MSEVKRAGAVPIAHFLPTDSGCAELARTKMIASLTWTMELKPRPRQE